VTPLTLFVLCTTISKKESPWYATFGFLKSQIDTFVIADKYRGARKTNVGVKKKIPIKYLNPSKI